MKTKVIDATKVFEKKRLLEHAKKERIKALRELGEYDEKTKDRIKKSSYFKKGAKNEVGAQRCVKKLQNLAGFVDGFGQWLNEETVRRLDDVIARLESGRPLPRSKFVMNLKEEAGIQTSL